MANIYVRMTKMEKKARCEAYQHAVLTGNLIGLKAIPEDRFISRNFRNGNALVRGKNLDELILVLDFTCPVLAGILLPAKIKTKTGKVIDVAEHLMGVCFHICMKRTSGSSRYRVKGCLRKGDKRVDSNIEEFLVSLAIAGEAKSLDLMGNNKHIHHVYAVWDLRFLMLVDRDEHKSLHNGDHSHRVRYIYDVHDSVATPRFVAAA